MGKKKSGKGQDSSHKEALADFWNAVQDGNLKAVKRLLPSIDEKRDRDYLDRAMINAVYGNNLKLLNLLLSAGADPDPAKDRYTLLMSASIRGKLEIVKRLIKAGADYNRQTKEGTALSEALCYNELPIVKYLEKLKAYSPPNLTLLYASTHGDIARAKRAIREGADLDKQGGTFEKTPLMAAASKGQLAAVKLLLKSGANPNKKIKGETALFPAVRHGKNSAVFNELLKAGANIHAKYYDETVLMAAVEGGNFSIVKRLVELGIDVNARDEAYGVTAMDRARHSKNKEIIDFLASLGAEADRDRPRLLMKALAKEFGGKLIEHSHGFALNSRFAGNTCSFSAGPGVCAITVHKLIFRSEALRKANFPSIRISPTFEGKFSRGFVRSQAGSKVLSLDVRTHSQTKDPIDSEAIVTFCRELKTYISHFNLVGEEYLIFHKHALKCFWLAADMDAVRPRLNTLEKIIQQITRPPQPERFLFAREWLIKSKPFSATNPFAHSFGGSPSHPIPCPNCGNATNRMIEMNFADPNLPSTSLGKTRVPIFWCLECLDWSPTSYDISNAIPKLIPNQEKKNRLLGIEPGEEDLAEKAVFLAPVPPGKKAGRKSKLGGAPAWIQSEETPDCRKCSRPMAFLLQLDSESGVMFGDMGMLYAFVCPECKIVTSLVQSH